MASGGRGKGETFLVEKLWVLFFLLLWTVNNRGINIQLLQ